MSRLATVFLGLVAVGVIGLAMVAGWWAFELYRAYRQCARETISAQVGSAEDGFVELPAVHCDVMFSIYTDR